MVERDWNTGTPEPGATIEAEGLVIRCQRPGGATLVSGNLDAAIAELAPAAPMLGLLEPLPPPPFALRIARDRALLCTAKPLNAQGWRNGYAASEADDLFLEITIAGRRAAELKATCMSPVSDSPSAATHFAGYGTLVASVSDGLSVRVQPSDAAALWAHLEKIADVL